MVLWVLCFLPTHTWQIEPISSICLKLILQVQKRSTVLLGGWLPRWSQMRGRGQTSSSSVVCWLTWQSQNCWLCSRALVPSSLPTFSAGGSLITDLTSGQKIWLIWGCRDASSWLCFEYSTVQTAFYFVDSDRWSLGIWRTHCFADPHLTWADNSSRN